MIESVLIYAIRSLLYRDINRIETIDLHAEDKGEEPYSPPIDKEHEDAEFGDFLYQTPFTDREDIIGNVPVTYSVNRAERQITEKRYSQLRPFFLFTDKRVIEHTLSNTTQYGRTLLATHSIKDTLKSRFPANNVHRRHEPVATDTIFADVPAIYSGGCKMAQGYVGRYSMVADAYLMKSEKEFVQTLTDFGGVVEQVRENWGSSRHDGGALKESAWHY